MIGVANAQLHRNWAMYVCGAKNAKKVARTKTVIVKAIAIATFGSPRGNPARSQRIPFNTESSIKWQL